MKCNNCGAELEEGVKVCPECGWQYTSAQEEPAVEEAVPAEEAQAEEHVKEEEKEKEATPIVEGRLTPGKIALLVVLAVAAVAVVIALIVGGITGREVDTTKATETAEQTEATEIAQETTEETTMETTEATIPADTGLEDTTCKGTYTVSDEEITAAKDTVVATLGDAQLTNSRLQVYYWMQFYDFMNSYSSYASLMGLDYTQSLDTQLSPDGVQTWQQYFLNGALSMWQSYAALEMKAEDAGYKLDEEYAQFLAELPQTLEDSAASSGYESAEAMLQADMGVGCTMDDYIEYMNEYYMGYLYYLDLVDAIELTDEEIEAYYTENEATFVENGVEKTEDTYVSVRHILICPEGGTTDESGNVTYSDEEWEACHAAAQAILDQWAAGEATEEAFAALANEQSQDQGSNTNGGLYTQVTVGQMVEPFENWCFEASRQYGDTGLVQTDYGYHVMYFVDSEPIWFASARDEMLSAKGTEILETAMSAYELNIDYNAIALGFVDFSTEE